MPDHNLFANLIWQIADLLRGPYRPPQYERVMLPMTVLRRFDCVLAPTKDKVLAEYRRWSEKLRDEALDAKLNQAAGQIDEIVKIYGRFEDSEQSKIFDNAVFGYTRVTVERPLRLRYQMTTEDKARFLDACPHLLDDVQAIDEELGREPLTDWNAAWKRIRGVLHQGAARWKKTEEKLFRDVFTQKDPEAAPVKAGDRSKGFEPDTALRDFENVPLKEDIEAYFEREVRPHVPDAWMDRSKDKVGYEINFNRHFYKYTPPRPLEEIDADLKKAEEEILRLLREVVE